MAQAPQPQIIVIDGKEKGRVFSLKEGVNVVGRGKADICLEDPQISRVHLALHVDLGGKVKLSDLKSLNGTQLNGIACESSQLKHLDRVQLGGTVFELHLDASPEEDAEKTSGRFLSNPQKELDTGSMSSMAEPALPKSSLSALPKSDVPTEPLAYARQLPQTLSRYFRDIVRSRQRALIYGSVALLAVIWLMRPKSHQLTLGEIQKTLTEAQALLDHGEAKKALALVLPLEKRATHSAEVALWLGDFYFGERQPERALLEYQRAHALAPVPDGSHVRLLRAYAWSGLTDNIRVELSHVNDVLQRHLARYTQNTSAGEGSATKASQMESRQILSEIAETFLEKNQAFKFPTEKLYILAKALENEIAPQSSLGYKLEASLLLNQNHYVEAATALQKAFELSPQDEWILENLAYAYLSLKDVTKASQLIETWLKIHPENTKALLVMGYLKFNDKDFTGGAQYLQRIIQQGEQNVHTPHYPEALHLMGQIAQSEQKLPEARSYLERSCALGYQAACSHDLVRSNTMPTGPSQAASSSLQPGATAASGELSRGPQPSETAQPRANASPPTLPSNSEATSPLPTIDVGRVRGPDAQTIAEPDRGAPGADTKDDVKAPPTTPTLPPSQNTVPIPEPLTNPIPQ